MFAQTAVDFGGQPGRAPNNWDGGQRLQKIEMRIFENIETTLETKTKNINTTWNTTMKTVISIINTL